MAISHDPARPKRLPLTDMGKRRPEKDNSKWLFRIVQNDVANARQLRRVNVPYHSILSKPILKPPPEWAAARVGETYTTIVSLLYLHTHEERVTRIGGRRDGELGLAVNRRIKGNVNIVG